MRCTPRKHVIEKGTRFCDCEAVMIGDTAAGNAKVVTILLVSIIEHAYAREAVWFRACAEQIARLDDGPLGDIARNALKEYE